MLERILQATTHYPEMGNALASLLLLIAVVGLRQLLVQWVRRSAIQSADLRRRWIVQIRNGCFLLVLMGLVFIWVTELLAIAFSIAAFIVALVLATKELILCLTGSFLKVSSRAFSVGDRIEVGTFRGDVIDQTLLVTDVTQFLVFVIARRPLEWPSYTVWFSMCGSSGGV
jgi:small-conductance mechanosensitive channel